ncbi:MAG TPA: phosphoribosylanthranilate isomerase [Clostridiales bacterium]|nr:phosphoribosylanthranilate isomerase [Clostridiales bacterium]
MTKIKICGLMTVADVSKVNRCAPEYAGFVFAPQSQRRVSQETAAEMKAALASSIQAVGVFVNEEIHLIAGLVKANIIDLVQLHGDEDESYIRELKKHINCPVVKSVAVANKAPKILPDQADYILFDTAAKERGGTGKRFDWSLIAETKEAFFLAGGLREENVAEAIKAANPYCVDVSSGVETNGIKDENKMRRFIQLVREVR